MIKIREFVKGDGDEIIRLVSDVLFEIFDAEAKNLGDLNDIRGEFFDKKGIFYVAEDNRKIVGVIGVRKKKRKTAELRRMIVHKDYRRKKIGQRLLNKVLEFCKHKRYKKIILSTYPQMKAALKFYQANGFKEFKRNEKIFLEKDL